MGTRYVGVAAETEYGGARPPTDFLDVVTESIVGEQNI